MAETPDFRVKTPSVDPRAFAEVLQRKQDAEDNNARLEQQYKDQRVQRIVSAIQGGQQIATNMMNLAEKRSQIEGEKQLQSLVNAPAPTMPAPTASSSVLPDKGTFNVQPSPEQTSNYDTLVAQRKQNLMQALLKANPQSAETQMAQQMFPEPGKTAANEFQSKQIIYNGKPMEAAWNPRDANFYDPITHEKLTGKIEPFSTASPMSEIRKQALRDRQTENLGKDLNELGISSNSPAGISAKRALFAKSGLNLIQQVEKQPGGADKRQTAELQMEVARVLVGNGVISNEAMNSLASNTAKSKIKNWEEWLTNKPTGLDQQKFIERFKETLDRQAKFHGDELDKYKQKNMAKYTTFEKQAPDEFYSSLEQAGYDVAKYKKTRKLVPTVETMPPEIADIAANLTPKKADFKDMSVEDLMKRRDELLAKKRNK